MYATMKRDSDDLKKEIRSLNFENEKLLKQLEMARSVSSSVGQSAGDKETARRLKKRELECQALWETIKDLQVSQRLDPRPLVEILAKRALDTKAKRKLHL